MITLGGAGACRIHWGGCVALVAGAGFLIKIAKNIGEEKFKFLQQMILPQ
jgi:hypothetical protein